MKSLSLIFLLLLAKTTAVFSQNVLLNEFPGRSFLAQSTNQQPSLNGSLTETLDHVFDSMTALTPVKGFNAAMLMPDGSLWTRASGQASENPISVPLGTENLMGMGSITKSFVSATILLLAEENLIKLDGKLSQYLPAYPNISTNATVRQLLSHRTGFNDFMNENPATWDTFWAYKDSIWVIDTILNHYVLAPNFPVNSAWSYSNTNYLLAGRIIESVTGQPWHQVVRQKILDPLGLTHTFAYPWETTGSLPISGVWLTDNFGLPYEWQTYYPINGLFSLASSAGCLMSNPEDLVRFSERLYGGHLLQPASLAAMQTDMCQGACGEYMYGLGTISMTTGIEAWGHGGSVFYRSNAYYYPTENMALAVQQNDTRTTEPNSLGQVPKDYLDVYVALQDAYLNYTSTSAVGDLAAEGALEVFPNPATWSISVEGLPEAADFEISDVAGKTLLAGEVGADKTGIDISRLPAGFYVFKTAYGSKKWVKMK